jgi:hypothetical protein
MEDCGFRSGTRLADPQHRHNLVHKIKTLAGKQNAVK